MKRILKSRGVCSWAVSGVLLLAPTVFAQSDLRAKPVDMAHVQIGKPFPYGPANRDGYDTMADQLGFYTFEAPNASDSALPFPQYQVAINTRTRAVYYVRATKPYAAMADCLDILRVVAGATHTRYGVPKRRLQHNSYEGVSGDLSIEGRCGAVGLSAYVQLTLSITSISQEKEFDEIRRKRHGR